MDLHHVALGARHVRQVADFYREFFSLPEVAVHHDTEGGLRSVWLDLGGSVLMVEQSSAPPHPVLGIGSGPFLLAFRCSAEERGKMELRLSEASVSVEARSEFTTYFRDPENNRVAISVHPL